MTHDQDAIRVHFSKPLRHCVLPGARVETHAAPADRTTAGAQALDAIRREAFERGRKEGMLTGRAAAMTEMSRRLAESIASLVRAYDSHQGQVERMLESLEGSFLDLAYASIEQVVHNQAARGQYDLKPLLAQAVTTVLEHCASGEIVLRVNPADLEAALHHVDQEALRARVRVVADDGVHACGVIVEGPGVHVDQSLEERLRALKQLLKPMKEAPHATAV
ncbi:MAG: FliH/SctL family protein [Planctomycetota bacterium]